MPRCARKKGIECTYHIMVKSISEVLLFKHYTDKDRYLATVKKYQNIFKFKVYAYCLMDTHAHFIIYANGADISKIMHGINQSYAQYFNRKYGRHGHLFQDRFKSIIVDKDEYIITLSGYVHNNPLSISKYKNCVERYPYSSLGIYLGLRRDPLDMVDFRFILEMYSKDIISARKKYMDIARKCVEEEYIGNMEFQNEICQYRSEKSMLVRNYNVDDIVEFVSQRTDVKGRPINIKHCHKTTAMRAICVLLMRGFCDVKCKDICKILGNITEARVSKLCSIGLELIEQEEKYKNLIPEFIGKYKAA